MSLKKLINKKVTTGVYHQLWIVAEQREFINKIFDNYSNLATKKLLSFNLFAIKLLLLELGTFFITPNFKLGHMYPIWVQISLKVGYIWPTGTC